MTTFFIGVPLDFVRVCPEVQTGNYYPERNMIAGVVLILAGLLLVLYPPLLSIIVATLLVVAGVLVIAVSHYERKLQRHYRNPTVEFFFWH
jgi:UPF0716 family protein affecting phage T7 exclusion